MALALFGLYLVTAVWNVYKPLPPGLNASFPPRAAADVEFLVDSTWIDARGQQHQDTEIFERLFEMIDQAEQLIVLEMFLINEFAGQASDGHRPLSGEVFDRLLAKRASHPSMDIVLITDPFNRLYGGVDAPRLDQLQEAGVLVIETRLEALRDSNPIWSGAWRLCCRWLGNSTDGWLPNPVGGEPVTLRTYLRLLNFKANHRKALVVDQGETWAGLVTSGNTHDASSRHSNVALAFTGPAALDLLETMDATARLSGVAQAWRRPGAPAADDVPPAAPASVQVLTEAAIREAILTIIEAAGPGERLDLAVFYLAHRDIVRALESAAQRGVELRVLLDPNEDAFGRKKDGVPNRQVAHELTLAGIPVRWCYTRGEQCHYKYLLHLDQGGQASMLLGSANFTRRNLDNLNLETQVLLRADQDHPQIQRGLRFFDDRWTNAEGHGHSLDYEAFADEGSLRYWRYRLMEASGLSTF
ncbi:phospholipase D family protein [Wenzhouxiangella marina]|uniref:phospholipase D n=1 Tax=Wenzhouxiangella marina TaxID=1579979 RepID=A0A0K0XWH0_9GAMM|nr:phospholipase D family protein [Wenzhouxiangella marina]AKS42049.1 phospholipase D [Wenzhouxiangella marina]MBB6086182.1 phosphatidylserine/phosphatidylglycerophosphate/cardiolipin synthase-like enzyme [Wenzhouxiangella marina]